MNGWVRIGIVLTVIWALLVSGYAIYELETFPMKPFVAYMGPLDSYYLEGAEKFFFIKITTKKNGDNLTSYEKEYFDDEIRAAKTELEKLHLLEARNLQESTSGLNGTFFIFIILTAILGWVICYSGVAATKWIAGGFKNSDKG